MKIAVIAGESSGDQLAADVIAALSPTLGQIELIGIGGPKLAGQGLASWFDYSELSIMGVTAVLKKLPSLLGHIRQTAAAIIAAKPDLLLIVDSPDFTHRVARKVKAALPDLPVVNYVCPSVWAWKEYRAAKMRAYVDLVLAILPFEPAVMEKLGGPQTRYVGHRLAGLPSVLAARASNQARRTLPSAKERTILIMPGSRKSEVSRLLPVFLDSARQLAAEGAYRFLLPAVPHLEAGIRAAVSTSGLAIEIISGDDAKWQTFGQADAAMAASGTALMELVLCGIPVVSAYKTDWLIRLMLSRIKIWSAALPNLVADYQAVPEFFNEMARPGLIARWVRRLAADTPERQAALTAFDLVADRMQMDQLSGALAARAILELLDRPGS